MSGSDQSRQRDTIDETVMADETAEQLYFEPTQYDSGGKVAYSADIFGTQSQTQLYDPQIDDSLLQETPVMSVMRGPTVVPETPASPRVNLSAFESIPETPHLSRIMRQTGSSQCFDSGGNTTPSGTVSQMADTQPVSNVSIITVESDEENPPRRVKTKRRLDDVIDLESSNSILEVSLVDLGIPPTLPGKDMKDFVAGILGEDSSSQDSAKSASPKKQLESCSPVKTARSRSDEKSLATNIDSCFLNINVEEVAREIKSNISGAPGIQKSEDDFVKPLVELGGENIIKSTKSPVKPKSPEKMGKMASTLDTNGIATEGEKENFLSATYDMRTQFSAVDSSKALEAQNREEVKTVAVADSSIIEIGNDETEEEEKSAGKDERTETSADKEPSDNSQRQAKTGAASEAESCESVDKYVVRTTEQSDEKETVEAPGTSHIEENGGDDEEGSPVHQNTQPVSVPVTGLSDTEPTKEELEDEPKDGSCSLQERTLSLEHFHVSSNFCHLVG